MDEWDINNELLSSDSDGSEYQLSESESEESETDGGNVAETQVSTQVEAKEVADAQIEPQVAPQFVDDVLEEPELVRGRKKRRQPERWKRSIAKRNRDSGLPYITRTGNNVEPKQFTNTNCNCKRKCNNMFTFDQRELLFKDFWKVGDCSIQNVYLRGLAQAKPIKQRRPKDGSRNNKSCSVSYFLKREKETIQVCKHFFTETFKISGDRTRRAISTEGITIPEDRRGKKVPKNKLDVTDIENHIKSFPCYVSHYSRAHNPNRKYLDESLTIQKMYEMYKIDCAANGKIALKQKMYYHVFSNKFNLHFKPPYQDTCQTCDSLKLKIEHPVSPDSKREAEIEKELHLRKTEQARNSLRADQASASEVNYVFTFDLQKALPFPKLTTSIAYYKRNMYVYNLGCHNFNSNQGFMYMWDETVASRGSQEIASCVLKHLKENALHHKQITMYTDCCTGQNRNIKMALSLIKLVNDPTMNVDIIDHKFLVSGHSFLPNDADFGVIESYAKKVPLIFGPEGWYDAARNAAKKTPYDVTIMKREDFKSTKKLEDAITNRKTTVDKGPVNWLKMKWLRFERGSPTTYKFKNTLSMDDPFSVVRLGKGSVGRPTTLQTLAVQNLLYEQPRQVTKEKKSDMFDLLKFIPPVNHAFYRNLVVAGVTRASAQNEEEEEEENEENIYV